mmetsp:Transcript_783/g.1858  ORF Transcript_783/g.1858 Transcript_783/m.1858 type:complete len:315 (+) Transcript_783:4240-5184(+)
MLRTIVHPVLGEEHQTFHPLGQDLRPGVARSRARVKSDKLRHDMELGLVTISSLAALGREAYRHFPVAQFSKIDGLRLHGAPELISIAIDLDYHTVGLQMANHIRSLSQKVLASYPSMGFLAVLVLLGNKYPDRLMQPVRNDDGRGDHELESERRELSLGHLYPDNIQGGGVVGDRHSTVHGAELGAPLEVQVGVVHGIKKAPRNEIQLRRGGGKKKFVHVLRGDQVSHYRLPIVNPRLLGIFTFRNSVWHSHSSCLLLQTHAYLGDIAQEHFRVTRASNPIGAGFLPERSNFVAGPHGQLVAAALLLCGTEPA